MAGHVTVGKNVDLSGFTAVHQFCTIGDYAFVAGGSLVRKDIPPYVKVAREPFLMRGKFCWIESKWVSRKSNRYQDIYRILFQKQIQYSQAARVLKQRVEKLQKKKDY